MANVLRLVNLVRSGVDVGDACTSLGMSRGMANGIMRGDSWSYVTGIDPSKSKRRKPENRRFFRDG